MAGRRRPRRCTATPWRCRMRQGPSRHCGQSKPRPGGGARSTGRSGRGEGDAERGNLQAGAECVGPHDRSALGVLRRQVGAVFHPGRGLRRRTGGTLPPLRRASACGRGKPPGAAWSWPRGLAQRGRLGAQLRQEQDLRRAITGLAGALDRPGSPGAALRGPDTGAPRAAEREALSEAEERYAALIEEVREREPGYANTIRPQGASWRRVAARLPTDAALLEYLVADSAVLLFVVTPHEVRTLDLGVDRRTPAALVTLSVARWRKPRHAAHRTPVWLRSNGCTVC